MTNEDLFALIDECRKRGVLQLRLKNGTYEEIEFMLAPQLGAMGEDVFSSLTKTEASDPAKCMLCQNAPRDGKLPGHCRVCSLHAAGVQ